MKKHILLFSLSIFIVSVATAYDLSGTAVDAITAEGLPNLELTLFTGTGIVKTTSTMSDGSFLFTGLQDGSQELVFHEIVPHVLNGIYYLYTEYGDPIQINGGNVSGVVFEIPPHYADYQIIGTLYDASTNEPIADQSLSLRLDFQAHSGFFYAWSAADGTYAFSDPVPDWDYVFQVFDNEYYFGDQIDLSIDTTMNDTIVVDFYLEPRDGVTVSGTLLDIETNEPIQLAGRTIRITAIDPYFAETNEEGQFEFVNVEPGYYANITVTSEDTSYINCDESTMYDFIVGETGNTGVEMYQQKFISLHKVTINDSTFIPGDEKSYTFSVAMDYLSYGAIWGVELHLPAGIEATSTDPFLRYYNNDVVFEYIGYCISPDELVWEGYHNVFGSGNVGNLQSLNDSAYAEVTFQFDNAPVIPQEIFYEVYYSYSCINQPFSYGTIVMYDSGSIVGQEELPATSQSLECFPIPADKKVTFEFNCPVDQHFLLTVRNIGGSLCRSVELNTLHPGIHQYSINTARLPDGIYFYSLTGDHTNETGKLIVAH